MFFICFCICCIVLFGFAVFPNTPRYWVLVLNSTPPARRNRKEHHTQHHTLHNTPQHIPHTTQHTSHTTQHTSYTTQHTSSHITHHTPHITRHTDVSHRGGNLRQPEASVPRRPDAMLRFRCSGDVPKRDAASPSPGTGRTSPIGGGNFGSEFCRHIYRRNLPARLQYQGNGI